MLAPSYSEDLVEAGCDEVGRGCLAGPVVAAAVVLPKGYNHPTLNDSKQLSKEAREALQIHIKANALAWAVAEVSHTEIDKINILKASFLAMHRAIDQLTVTPELLLVDGNRFTPYLGIAHVCVVKGDSKFSAIAAASVLAKCYRDDLMANLAHQYPGYGWERNVGYPTVQHRKAIQALGVTPHHRLSFKLL